MALTHHDLCFGCGQANLFGLHVELERQPDGSVAGRFFVKQDHQGPPGVAHGGVLAAALDEAMGLAAAGPDGPAIVVHLEVDLRAPARVGTFVALEASVERANDRKSETRAAARGDDGTLLAEARGVFLASAR
jgi:acyl-coenzyme A thioesterase PaaI-like protein